MQYLISLQNPKLLLQNPPEISAKDFYSETQILRRFHKKTACPSTNDRTCGASHKARNTKDIFPHRNTPRHPSPHLS